MYKGQFYEWPLNYRQGIIRQEKAVTVEDIRAAFRRELDADRLAIVSIGPRAPAKPGSSESSQPLSSPQQPADGE